MSKQNYSPHTLVTPKINYIYNFSFFVPTNTKQMPEIIGVGFSFDTSKN